MIPHLLRCQGLSVVYYGFTLDCLVSGASSTFEQIRYNKLWFLVKFVITSKDYGYFAADGLLRKLVPEKSDQTRSKSEQVYNRNY